MGWGEGEGGWEAERRQRRRDGAGQAPLARAGRQKAGDEMNQSAVGIHGATAATIPLFGPSNLSIHPSLVAAEPLEPAL